MVESSIATRAGGVARTRSSSASASVNGLSGAGARKSGWYPGHDKMASSGSRHSPGNRDRACRCQARW